jgi:DNA-binding transcriptional regulator WhiA
MFAIFVTALFKDDYPDLRALPVCSFYPFLRYYGSELKTADGNRDAVCNHTTNYDIELFSSSLAKVAADYYNFDYDNVSDISSGGDIGYKGVIKKEKIATEAQKMSFLAGVFLRYGWILNPNDSAYSVIIPNSLSTAKECVDILKEFGCNNVIEITAKHTITFNASDKIKNLISMLQYVFDKISGVLIAY